MTEASRTSGSSPEDHYWAGWVAFAGIMLLNRTND
ncbi:hypothetical protein FHX44_11914 [Pseudonocardia hierapolitana]|uniref:Uncharacterized protein n=1 Tax=Pseudonocardia hierapolitana TaxID=1128676 RepID=A0A561SJH8_9PSEU|nr:hypothetical protein FHX44_11914 [Pseudonocardia hierapolitana]